MPLYPRDVTLKADDSTSKCHIPMQNNFHFVRLQNLPHLLLMDWDLWGGRSWGGSINLVILLWLVMWSSTKYLLPKIDSL